MSAAHGLHHAVGDVSQLPDVGDAAAPYFCTMIDMTKWYDRFCWSTAASFGHGTPACELRHPNIAP